MDCSRPTVDLRFHESVRGKRSRAVCMASGGQSDSVQSVDQEHICILGGGFGGLYTALQLSRLAGRGPKPKITLVDKRDKFTFLPLLYELAVEDAQLVEVAALYTELLCGTGVQFVQAQVEGVDLGAKGVTITGARSDMWEGAVVADEPDQERTLHYSKLVLALGGEPSLMDKVPGARQNALPFYNIEDCYRVQQQFRLLKASDKDVVRVVIVGGSYSGVELACNLKLKLDGRPGGKRAQVTLVTRGPQILKNSLPANKAAGVRQLKEVGVEILHDVTVKEITPQGVVLEEQEDRAQVTLAADLVVWTAGVTPNPITQSLELPKDGKGRLLVDQYLAVKDAQGSVYCLGDLACVEGNDVPGTAQVALQQSDYVAYNLWAASRSEDPLPFRYADLGELLTLGPRDGAVSTLNEKLNFSGPAGNLARRLIYAARMPTNQQRLKAGLSLGVGTVRRAADDILERTFGITRVT